jgi:hypothetical protein
MYAFPRLVARTMGFPFLLFRTVMPAFPQNSRILTISVMVSQEKMIVQMQIMADQAVNPVALILIRSK